MSFRIAAVIVLILSWISAVKAETGGIYVLDIKGVVGPATSDYIHRSFEKAQKNKADFIIIRMDTPGGLSTAMREIIQDILKSPIPVVGYVTPRGARAASAGTYILYAVHFSAMAPGTNLGAATPVQVGGGGGLFPTPKKEEKKDKDKDKEKDKKAEKTKAYPTIKDKVINDSVAYIKSLAKLRNRNVEWAEKAVSEAASLPADEAQKLNVVDFLADDMKELLTKLDGKEVKISGVNFKLETKNAKLVELAPDWRSQFLSVITNPNVAYILMLIGFYGLILEFYSPGLAGPGIIGSISLLLAFYSFNVLPINYAAFGLILLGIIFMVLEAYSPSFGILGIGGAVAFIVGSIMLIDTDVEEFRLAPELIVTVGILCSTFFLIIISYLGFSRRRPIVTGLEHLIGAQGKVLEWTGNSGRVRMHGEIWRAESDGTFTPGNNIRVKSINGLVLIITPDT